MRLEEPDRGIEAEPQDRVGTQYDRDDPNELHVISLAEDAIESRALMRILFTFAGGSGHLEPLVPIARAAEAVGHVVAFAGRPWMIPVVEALGFLAFAAGSDVGLTPKRLPLAAVDLQRDMQAIGFGFGRRIARQRAADLLPLCTDWQPDLPFCQEPDFRAM